MSTLWFIRERADEVEKELERQQFLELERSKTRELRHNLEMEKEKQAQARITIITSCRDDDTFILIFTTIYRFLLDILMYLKLVIE